MTGRQIKRERERDVWNILVRFNIDCGVQKKWKKKTVIGQEHSSLESVLIDLSTKWI